MQQARATVFGIAALALGQRLALQPAQLAEQDRNLARLPGALLDIAGELLQRLAQFPRQVQGQQLLGQFAESIDVLLGALLAALFGVEHGLFQARNQARQAGVHVVATEDLAQLLHALVDRLVAAFGRQTATHQAATQQVDPGIPAPLQALLLLDVLQVLVFPALDVVATHGGLPASPRTTKALSRRLSGRRISTDTGRWSEIGWSSTSTRSRARSELSRI